VINRSRLAVSAVIQISPATAHTPPQTAPIAIKAGAIKVTVVKIGIGFRTDIPLS
jgi:hypothetical protein